MACHYWDGQKGYCAAFVFSAPGRMEADSGRPVTGDTGSNMDQILQELKQLNPATFPSSNRYDYLITNSSPRVFYAKKDNGKTEDTIMNVTDQRNVLRVMKEIESCSIVILCGKRAQQLKNHIQGKTVVVACHFGNKGLRSHYPNRHPEMIGLESREREAKRKLLCAKSIHSELSTDFNEPLKSSACGTSA